jgi:sulfur-carrier protein
VPRLRLFGPAAEAAGTRVDDIPGTNLSEVLGAARSRYGEAFGAIEPICRVWINGETPDEGMTLGADDEVALLPPVSGG